MHTDANSFVTEGNHKVFLIWWGWSWNFYKWPLEVQMIVAIVTRCLLSPVYSNFPLPVIWLTKLPIIIVFFVLPGIETIFSTPAGEAGGFINFSCVFSRDEAGWYLVGGGAGSGRERAFYLSISVLYLGKWSSFFYWNGDLSVILCSPLLSHLFWFQSISDCVGREGGLQPGRIVCPEEPRQYHQYFSNR